MSSFHIVVVAGCAMFSMFFGSGNLVYPLHIGIQTFQHYGYGMLGLLVSDVLVPFLGLLSMALYGGQRYLYFATLGRYAPFVLTLLMLSLIGPFGVAPRCIIVAYGGFQLLTPDVPLEIFSALFCILSAITIWHHHWIIEIIGRWLTPWLLGGILLVIGVGIWQGADVLSSMPPATPTLPAIAAFKIGMIEGYQMMDLIAAFFFSMTIIRYVQSQTSLLPSAPSLFRLSLYASLLAAFMLAIVYIGLVRLGAQFAPLLTKAPLEHLLIIITQQTLGTFALPIASLVIILACFTTAVVVIRLFADFMHSDLGFGWISHPVAIIITTLLTFAISLLGFKTIMMTLDIILEILYPALIGLTVGTMIDYRWKTRVTPWLFWGGLIFNLFQTAFSSSSFHT